MNKQKRKLNFVIITPILFLGIEVIARMYDWYNVIPIYDLLSHLLFGIAFYSLVWYKFNFNKKKTKYDFGKISIMYLGIAFFWEWLETIGDNIFINSSALKDVFFFDGVTDIIMGFVGLYLANKYLSK